MAVLRSRFEMVPGTCMRPIIHDVVSSLLALCGVVPGKRERRRELDGGFHHAQVRPMTSLRYHLVTTPQFLCDVLQVLQARRMDRVSIDGDGNAESLLSAVGGRTVVRHTGEQGATYVGPGR